MDRLAVIVEDTFLYWNSIVLVAAAAAGICFFLSWYLGRNGYGAAAAVAIPTAIVLSLVLGRLIHWYFRPDGYSGFLGAVTDYTRGGYALLGCFLGCGLTALLVRLLGLEKKLGRMLDAMSMGGCAAIALGRLACFFSAADRGQLLATFRSLPFAYPVINAVSGATEYRLATFLIQAAAVGLIFFLLIAVNMAVKLKYGETTVLFLLLYSVSQTILDSTRYDSLYMRSNGFISVVQLVSAVTLLVMCIVITVRMIRFKGFRLWLLPCWLTMLTCLGGAGYMEYYVQRHGDQALFAYSVMTGCLLILTAMALTIFYEGTGQRKYRGKY